MLRAVEVPLHRALFSEAPRLIAREGGFKVSAFRYPTGVEAVEMANDRGRLVVLPFMGQMIWDAAFDSVDLCMGNAFAAPRPARAIAETYGCFAFHSGLLRNGVPGPEDDHAAHGEMPCAPMDDAALIFGEDAEGPFLQLSGGYEYVMGFGAHYLAQPSVTLRSEARFEMAMEVRNLSAAPMELMYMAHVNFAFAPGARIRQPAPFTPERTEVRAAVPAHVTPTPDYLERIETLRRDPALMEVLDQTGACDPEQVFYIKAPGVDSQGMTHLMLERTEGDGFALSYAPAQFPHLVRWILAGGDAQVAAFALPSTCQPEGYTAEKAKGHVRLLAPGERAGFAVRMGYLTAAETRPMAVRIDSLGQ